MLKGKKSPLAIGIGCSRRVQVLTGSVEAAVGSFATVVLNGTATTIPVEQTVAGAGQMVTVLACAGVSPGVPIQVLPAL